jgi:hypothetical protein
MAKKKTLLGSIGDYFTGGGVGTADEVNANVKKRFGTPEKKPDEKPAQRPADPNVPVEHMADLATAAMSAMGKKPEDDPKKKKKTLLTGKK